MSNTSTVVSICPVCGEPRAPHDLVPGRLIRRAVAECIAGAHPGWTIDQSVCMVDLRHYQLAHLEDVLEERLTLGDGVADHVASFGGSWTFIIGFFAVLAGWIVLNAVWLARKPFDPYPFILLNLVLSCLAAIQAPIIMMSQNRQSVKDRAGAEHDYQVNLKAELEVRLLHEKLDHLILHQWQRLLETQRLQAEMLDGLAARLEGARPEGGTDAESARSSTVGDAR